MGGVQQWDGEHGEGLWHFGGVAGEGSVKERELPGGTWLKGVGMLPGL